MREQVDFSKKILDKGVFVSNKSWRFLFKTSNNLFSISGTDAIKYLAPVKAEQLGGVVVAQLIAQLHPIAEDPGSNPVIGNFYRT